MSVLLKNLSDFLKLLVQSFNLSSTFPALVFVILAQLHILPLLPEKSPLRLLETWSGVGQAGAAVILVVLIAYFLDVANKPIIRLFEGYWFLDQIPFNWWRRRSQKYVHETLISIRKLERLADDLIKRGREEKRKDLLDLAKVAIRHKRKLIKEIALKYPEDPEYVLPSPFGNVIAASEQYPKKVFDMDAIVLWPFLVPTLIQKNYSQIIVREKAVMDFCINLTVLMMAFGCLFGWVEYSVNGWSWGLMIKLGCVALSCVVMFLLSIQGAAGWGAAIRAAFVIFREDLRRTLRLRRARYYEDERKLWRAASDFFRAQGADDKQKRWGHSIFDVSTYASADLGTKEGE